MKKFMYFASGLMAFLAIALIASSSYVHFAVSPEYTNIKKAALYAAIAFALAIWFWIDARKR